MNTIEAGNVSKNTMIEFYGANTWAFVVRSCSPLIIFYRFHSSVCFAEIWKEAYGVDKSTSEAIAVHN
jgi:hypothetical protein